MLLTERENMLGLLTKFVQRHSWVGDAEQLHTWMYANGGDTTMQLILYFGDKLLEEIRNVQK